MTHCVKLEKIKINRNNLLSLARLFAHEEGTLLFYSGGEFQTSNRSFLCLFPYEFIWIHGNKKIRSHAHGENISFSKFENPWDALKELLSNFSDDNSFPEWMGFLTYEMGAFSDPDKQLPFYPSNIPEAYFQRCALVLVVDHNKEESTVLIADQGEYFLNEQQKEWLNRLSRPEHWNELLQGMMEYPITLNGANKVSLAKPIETYEEYAKKILTAKELINSGTIYQVNLSHQFLLEGHVDPFQLFYRINSINPAPFAAYLHLRNFSIVSSSPERFLKKRGANLETRPIKGTMPRGQNPQEDEFNKEKLVNSIKDKAELLMITDLMRNDLSRVSKSGSVETVQMWECEEYTNVFHLSSTVCSEARPDLHPVDIVRACFPGGSITGCPKITAMEVITELERRNRGIYTGAIGYFAGNGDFDFNIAIRTLLISDNFLSIQLGGAIVADSDPLKEYEETLHKGESIFKGLSFDLTVSK